MSLPAMRILFLFFLCTGFLSSCLRNEGCTDYSAFNYDHSAEASDNSCLYLADIAIYWSSGEYNNYLSDSGSVTLNFYLDDKFIGNAAADDFITTSVNCSSPQVPIKKTDTLYYDSVYKKLKVSDQDGKIMYDYWIQLNNGCNEFSLQH